MAQKKVKPYDERTNPVYRAMLRLGGRAEHLAALCGVTAPAVQKWLEAARVHRGRDAIVIARALLAAGTPISIEELCGEEPLMFPSGNGGGPKGRKGGTVNRSCCSAHSRSDQSHPVALRLVRPQAA